MEDSGARPLLPLPMVAPYEQGNGATDRPLSVAWMSEELIAKTRRVWSPLYGRVISADEAVEILSNVKRLAEVLLRAEREKDKA